MYICKNQNMTNFTSIPAELLHLTAFYLGHRDIVQLFFTNKRIRTVFSSQKFLENYGLQYLSCDKTRLPANVLKELYDIEMSINSILYFEKIGKKGYDKYLTKIIDNLTDADKECVLENASSSGYLDIIQLVDDAKGIHRRAFKYAARNDHKNVMKYFYQNDKNKVIGYTYIIQSLIVKNEINTCKNILQLVGSENIEITCEIVTKIAQRGIFDSIIFLLHSNIGVCCMGMKEALLKGAAISNRMVLVRYLVDKGANVHTEDDVALVVASDVGNINMIKYLIDKGAVVSADDYRCLRFAVRNGQSDAVKYLIEIGADIHVKSEYCLRMAATKGLSELVRFLLEKGANVSAKNNQALNNAVQSNHFETVKILVDAGACITKDIIEKASDDNIVDYLKDKVSKNSNLCISN